ncbi:MAG: site-specific integrase [Rhodococcus sp. (in: high G+C Gram-positive bacteria)]|uniref:tyrosine-type recombinase/integrase n=1 Tax=Rhodococcus sp. TaxID=1831 RepID=UPI003BB0D322
MTETKSPRPVAQRRNRRAGVEDRWISSRTGAKTTRYGKGNRWLARFVDHEGREHSKSFPAGNGPGEGEKAAREWLDQQTADLVTGRFVGSDARVRTVGTMADEWMKHREHLKPKTVAGYRSLLDGLVLPTWRDVVLADVDYAGIRSWVTAMQKGKHRVAEEKDGQGRTRIARPLSASRTIQAYQVLKMVLDDAVHMKMLPANPASGVPMPRKIEAERRYLDHQQVDSLATECGELGTMVYVLSYCGLRFGEVVALHVRDVDLAGARLTIRRSVTYVAGEGFVEGTTKGHESRAVPVPAFLVEMLREHLEGSKSTALVFPGKAKWMTPGEFRWKFDTAASAVGVDGLVPHELRHTAASLAIRSGANVKVVQKMLGHKAATLTLDRYGHLFPDELDALATRLDTDRTKALSPSSEDHSPLSAGRAAMVVNTRRSKVLRTAADQRSRRPEPEMVEKAL